MTKPSMDAENIARAFPRPLDSRPARSLTYHCDGRIYRAVIGEPRRQRDAASRAGRVEPAWPQGRRASGNTVVSIVATRAAVEIWSCEPAGDWPNPSLVAPDAVLNIDYLDNPDSLASLCPGAGCG